MNEHENVYIFNSNTTRRHLARVTVNVANVKCEGCIQPNQRHSDTAY